MAVLIAPPPKDTQLLDKGGRISEPWISWFNSLTATGVIVNTLQTAAAGAEGAAGDAGSAALLADVAAGQGNLGPEVTGRPAVVDYNPFSDGVGAGVHSAIAARFEDVLALLETKAAGWMAECAELRALLIAGDPAPLAAAAALFDPLGAAAAAQAASLQIASNLSDVASAPTSRTNLGLGTAATQASSAFDAAGAAAAVLATSLQKASNLSDVASAASSRTNLGLTAAAVAAPAALTEATSAVLTITGGGSALLAATSIQVKQASGSQAGYLASADWTTFNGKDAGGAAAAVLATSLQKASNLSDLGTVATARTNLGLGAAALLATPIPIVSGGTGATTFLAAGLPTLAASNTFTGATTLLSTAGAVLGIGRATASVPVHLADALGDKIYLYGDATGVQYGIGIQVNEFRSFAGSPSGGFTWGVQTGGTFTQCASLSSAGALAVASLTLTGNVSLAAVGNGFKIKEGTNARLGVSTLVAGSVTVANTSITATTRVFLTNDGGGVLANYGTLYLASISAGVSFTIKSTNALDTATFDWLLIEAL